MHVFYALAALMGPLTAGIRVQPLDKPSMAEPIYQYVLIGGPSGSCKVCMLDDMQHLVLTQPPDIQPAPDPSLLHTE
jgi:hypothetical protein